MSFQGLSNGSMVLYLSHSDPIWPDVTFNFILEFDN